MALARPGCAQSLVCLVVTRLGIDPNQAGIVKPGATMPGEPENFSPPAGLANQAGIRGRPGWDFGLRTALQTPAHRDEICGNEAHLHHIPIGRVARTVLGGQNHQPVEWAPVNAFLALFRPFGTS